MVESMRLNKFLAECGVASRRACDKLIEEGRVFVNGKEATLGTIVHEKDVVKVDDKEVQHNQQLKYYIMNKPKGYVCTVKDDRDRKTVLSLIPQEEGRIYPVGRLDYDTEGLLLLTNDGDLSFRLTHPVHEIPKTYLAKIEGELTEEQKNKLINGIMLDGRQTHKSKLKVIEVDKKFTKLHITIYEGRNRQIRRMFEAVGKEVVFLKRIKIGDMPLGNLKRGEVRKLSAEEIFYLKHL